METGTAMGRAQQMTLDEAYTLVAAAWRDFMEDIARAEILVEQSKKL